MPWRIVRLTAVPFVVWYHNLRYTDTGDSTVVIESSPMEYTDELAELVSQDDDTAFSYELWPHRLKSDVTGNDRKDGI